jgi:hypothetical protein
MSTKREIGRPLSSNEISRILRDCGERGEMKEIRKGGTMLKEEEGKGRER